MTLWMLLTILCSAASVIVAAPFLRSYGASPDTRNTDLQFYRDQLSELEREVAESTIDAGQADGARAEIRRRLLKADNSKAGPVLAASLAGNQLAVIGVCGIVMLGSVLLYANMGRPELPAASLAARHTVHTSAMPAPLPGASTAAGPEGTGGTSAGLASVEEMIERIVLRLKQNPAHAEDWRMLGWSYFGIERFTEAAEAYGKAVALQPKNAALLASQGEALVRATQGAVSPQAKTIFETTVGIDPKEPRARFFLGLAKEQAGDAKAALADWIALAKEADPAEAWLSDLKLRIAELAQALGAAVPEIAQGAELAPAIATGPPPLSLLKDAEPAAAAAPAQPGPQRGPTAADVKAAESLSPGDRNAMIRGMVDGLAARLEKSPRDADGWIKLMRSHKILGEDAAAAQALRRALETFADTPTERAQIVAAAMELQVKP